MAKKSNDNDVEQAILTNDIVWIKDKLSDIERKVSNHFVTKEEFEPYKRLVQGIVAIVMTSVVGALLTLVLIK